MRKPAWFYTFVVVFVLMSLWQVVRWYGCNRQGGMYVTNTMQCLFVPGVQVIDP